MTVERPVISSPVNWAIAVPYFGGKDWEHERCMRAVEKYGSPIFMTIGHPYIDMARAKLTYDFLAWERPKLDCLLFIDHDILFNPSDVPRIIESALRLNTIVGAAYPKKNPGADLIGTFHPSITEVTFYEGGGCYPCDDSGVGMGFTAIPRTVFEALSELPEMAEVISAEYRVRPFFHHLIENGVYFGEDFSFCRRALKVGFRSHLDTRIRLRHKGSYAYAVEDCGMVVPQAFETLTVKLGEKKPPQEATMTPNRLDERGEVLAKFPQTTGPRGEIRPADDDGPDSGEELACELALEEAHARFEPAPAE